MNHCVVSLDLTSVVTLVIWVKDVFSAYPSGNFSVGAPPMAASLADWSATSLPSAPLCAGTQWMVTSFSAAARRDPTLMATTPKRCPGIRLSSRILAKAEVESTKTVYQRPLSSHRFKMRSACQMANTSASKTSLFMPSGKRRPVHPPSGGLQTHAAPTAPLSCLEPSVQIVTGWPHSFAVGRASSFHYDPSPKLALAPLGLA